jgi:hypothetical protein
MIFILFPIWIRDFPGKNRAWGGASNSIASREPDTVSTTKKAHPIASGIGRHLLFQQPFFCLGGLFFLNMFPSNSGMGFFENGEHDFIIETLVI